MKATNRALRNGILCMMGLVLIGPSLPGLSRAQAENDPGREKAGPAGEPEAAVPDVFELSLEELMGLDVSVEVASLFRERDLLVGSTVELVTRDNWERRGARSVHDAVGHLPSTILLPDVFGGRRLTIRGFAGRLLSGTAVLLDGVPINSLDVGTALFEINGLQLGVLDRIEMVRGPGSAIYGEDAFQGVLALHTYSKDRDAVEVESEAGSDGYVQGAARLSHGIKDVIRVHSAFAYTHQPDQDTAFRYTDPGTGGTGTGEFDNRVEAFMGLVKMETDHDRPLSAHLGLYFNESRTDDFPGVGTFTFEGRSALRDRDLSGADSQFAMVNGGLVGQLPRDVSLEINGFYWQINRDRFAETAPAVSVDVENDAYRSGAHVLLKQPGNPWHTQWLLGAGYDVSTIDKHTVTPSASGRRLPTTTGGQQGIDRENLNLVMQAKTSLLDDHVHVLYGGRLDNYSDFGTEFSPRAGLIYQPVPDAAVKLLYGNAFRPATAGELAGTSSVPGNPDLDAETIDTYELVFMRKTESWKAQVTLFLSEWDDAIVIGEEGRDNTGENEAYGAEMGFSLVQGHARLDLTGSLVESKDETNDTDYGAFPRFILNPGAGLTLPAYHLELYVVTRIHLDAKEGPVTAADADPPQLKDYWRTDVTAMWTHPRRDLELFVNLLNVFDRDNSLPSINSTENGIPDIAFTTSIGLRRHW